jgi:glycine cleavage system aminomethyltransferase T
MCGEALPWGDEPILRDGRMAGAVTSAAFGHTLGRAVAMGYYIETGAFALDIGGEGVPARPALAAPYDPRGLRIKS